MKSAGGLILCLIVCRASGLQSDGATRSPVERVVNLLKDLKAKINSDGAGEEQTYNKYACWCEKTTERKAKAIEKAQDELRALSQSILMYKGEIATLAAEIAQLKAAIRQNKKQQEDATALRTKENGAFMEETAEMKQALAALEKAVHVLKEGTALLQSGAASGAVRNLIDILPSTGGLKSDQLALLTDFASSGGSAKYAPQSWTVQGILRDMYQTFASDLESATHEEATKNRDYELFMHVKYTELKDLEATQAKKEDQKAEAESSLANTQQVFDDASAQMQADIAFFDEAKKACEDKHAEWTTRASLRKEELEGIDKALEILTTDEARELFGRAIKAGKETGADASYDTKVDINSPVLLQVDEEDGMAAPVASAYKMIKAQATRAGSLRLAALAARVHEAKVGHFDKVLQAIDEMVQTLKDEDAADIGKRDQCKDEYKNTASRIANITWLIEVNEATIDKLDRIIDKRTAEKEQTIGEIADTVKFIADIGAQRTAENADFLAAKKDDTDAIGLLTDAREVLTKYYVNNSIDMGPIQGGVKDLALDQQGPEFEVSADQAPEAEFSGKGHRTTQTKGIVQIMTMIIEDLNEEIMNAMKDEEAAHVAYEKQLAAAEKLKAELEDKKTNLEKMIADREAEKSAEIVLKGNNENDLKNEKDYKEKITPDCDWIIGAFSKRASGRAAEMQGLVKAKEYLAGYAPPEAPALLDNGRGKRKFDDKKLSNSGFLGFKQ